MNIIRETWNYQIRDHRQRDMEDSTYSTTNTQPRTAVLHCLENTIEDAAETHSQECATPCCTLDYYHAYHSNTSSPFFGLIRTIPHLKVIVVARFIQKVQTLLNNTELDPLASQIHHQHHTHSHYSMAAKLGTRS